MEFNHWVRGHSQGYYDLPSLNLHDQNGSTSLVRSIHLLPLTSSCTYTTHSAPTRGAATVRRWCNHGVDGVQCMVSSDLGVHAGHNQLLAPVRWERWRCALSRGTDVLEYERVLGLVPLFCHTLTVCGAFWNRALRRFGACMVSKPMHGCLTVVTGEKWKSLLFTGLGNII